MDPQANIQEQIALAVELEQLQDGADDQGNLSTADLIRLKTIAFRLGELVTSLVEWQIGGGSRPNLHMAGEVLRFRRAMGRRN